MTHPISVETHIQAPIEKIWECWTKPEHIMQWTFASPEWHVPSAINDIRTGGSFNTRMEAKDGSFGFDFAGMYTNVVENELIEYSLEDGRKVKIEFIHEEDGYLVRETFDPENENTMEMQKSGWQSILDNFKKHVLACL
ncbi:MAG: SRPBCC family protein [Patescibacteria group bacterium]